MILFIKIKNLLLKIVKNIILMFLLKVKIVRIQMKFKLVNFKNLIFMIMKN